MKANEFIKEHGLQHTKSIIEQFPKHTHVTNDGRMFIDEDTCCNHIKNQLGELVKMSELKRLVESHELVEKDFGSIEIAEYEHMVSGCYSDPYWLRVKQAILDVESCQ